MSHLLNRNLRSCRYHVRRGIEIAGPVHSVKTRRARLHEHRQMISSLPIVRGYLVHLQPRRPKTIEVEA